MKTFITTWFFPPGMALLLLAIGLYLLWRKNMRAVWGVLIAAFVIGWVLAMPFTGRVLSIALIAQIPAPAEVAVENVDMIITLTGGMEFVGSEIGWLPTNESYRRGIVATELQNRIGSRVPILFSGGHTQGANYPAESEVLMQYFDRHQAQLTPMLVETSSTDTYESALQVASLLQKRGARAVFLVTSELHMPRALATYRARGINAIPFPVINTPRGPFSLTDLLPRPQGIVLTANALYEIYGIIQYMVIGRISAGDM